MPTRTKDQNTLVLGEWNTICDACGFKFKSSDLRRRWDGFMVCKDDWEPRHPMDYFEGTPDKQSVPWSRPEATDAGGTDIDGDTFPPDLNTTTAAAGEDDTDTSGYAPTGTVEKLVP